MLADEEASPEQIEVLRRMTPEQRWRAAHRLYWTMRRHKTAFLHSSIPSGPSSRSSKRCAVFFSMPEPDLIELFVHPLSVLGVRYLVTGSVAAMLYGEPRVTHDVD